MIKSYLKTAYRFLLKNRTFSFINIFGLAAGTLCCLYIVLYVEDQYNYDRQQRAVGKIYRVDTRLELPGSPVILAGRASPSIAPALKKDFAAVEQFTRIVPTEAFGAKEHTVKYGDKVFDEKEVMFADSTFFDVFNFHFINGSALSALREPYTVVLLKPTADKLFGAVDPIGKTITIDNAWGTHEFTVTGVIDESLGKSQIHANIFISMHSNGIGNFTY